MALTLRNISLTSFNLKTKFTIKRKLLWYLELKFNVPKGRSILSLIYIFEVLYIRYLFCNKTDTTQTFLTYVINEVKPIGYISIINRGKSHKYMLFRKFAPTNLLERFVSKIISMFVLKVSRSKIKYCVIICTLSPNDNPVIRNQGC